MKTVLIALGVIVLLAGCSLATSYNGLVGSANQVRTDLANLESVYQRRADLVGQSLPTVIAGAQQELAVFKALRDQAVGMNKALNPQPGDPALNPSELINLMKNFDQALVNVSVYVADNPEIVSDQLFSDFMVQIEGSENRINIARRDYNASVQSYRNTVQFFPGNIVAGLFGFDANEFPFFEAEQGAEQAPEVVFPTPIP